MASVRKELLVDAPAERVWEALRDYGAVHRRVVPGFVVECTLEGDVRAVRFFDGTTVRERLVGADDEARRLAYTVIGGRLEHHNASVQALDEASGRCRVVWITDLLPDAYAEHVGKMMDRGIDAMREGLASSAG